MSIAAIIYKQIIGLKRCVHMQTQWNISHKTNKIPPFAARRMDLWVSHFAVHMKLTYIINQLNFSLKKWEEVWGFWMPVKIPNSNYYHNSWDYSYPE